LLGAGLALVQPCASAPFVFENTASLGVARYLHTATLLPNGKVLVAGGSGPSGPLASAELYDSADGSWAVTGSLNTARVNHTGTLLPNGKVLVAGGDSRPKAELYDPASGSWTPTGNMTSPRSYHTATLLPNGKVLVAGGLDNIGISARAELYDVGLGFSSLWQPEIATASSRLTFGNRHVVLTGSRFQGISQASGGNAQDSSSNYPIVQVRSLDSSQVLLLPVDPVGGWSDTSFRSVPVRDFPPGPAMVTVFTNGIPSAAKSLLVGKSPDP
jgi:hypothetical protein